MATATAPYSPRYLLVEALSGGLAALLWQHFGPTYQFLYYSVLACLVIVIFFIDLDYWIILDATSLGGMLVGLAGSLFLPGVAAITTRSDGGLRTARHAAPARPSADLRVGSLWSATSSLPALRRWERCSPRCRRPMWAVGTVKFAALIGAFLGWENAMLSFVLAFWIGGDGRSCRCFSGGKRRQRDPIPFGTFYGSGGVPGGAGGRRHPALRVALRSLRRVGNSRWLRSRVCS